MLAVSARWAAAVAANHQPRTLFQVWRTGTQLIPDLAVTGGTVTKDASGWPRTTATLEVADTSPTTAQLLTPFGSRVRIWRGLRYYDNTTELLLLADLDIVASRLTRPDGGLTLELADPAGAVSADETIRPWPYPARPVGTVIADLIATAVFYGGHTLADSTANSLSVNTAADYAVDGDRWDAIEQLADSIGAECFFTPDRQPVLRPEPTLKTTPDASLYAGEGGVVTGTDSELARAPNLVALWGGPDPVTGKQIRGLASDTDTGSPTWIGGPYGRVVHREDRPVPFANQAAANTAAANLLARVRTGVRTVQIECVPNPALEPGDTVQVRYAGGQTEKHLIRSLTIPLGPQDIMTVGCSTTAYSSAGWP